MPVVKSKPIRDAAKDQKCSIAILGVCNYDSSTSVMAHINSPIKGYKSSDLGGCLISCSACHDAIDRRVINEEFEKERDWYILRGVQITLDRLYDLGIVSVKGS